MDSTDAAKTSDASVTADARPADDFPRQFARTRRFSLGVPAHFTVSPDGRRVLFVRTGGGTDPIGRLWLYEDGKERLLADPARLAEAGSVGLCEEDLPEEERVRRERARERAQGVVAYAADRAARVVAFALSGALWVVRTDEGDEGGRGGEGAPFLVPTAGPVVDPRPSPDGRYIAYVTGGSLHVVELDGDGDGGGAAGEAGGPGADRRLAAAEGPDVTYGLAEYTAAESMGRLRGYWWSPDSRRLLVARVDTSGVQRRYISDPARPEQPPRAIRYPAAGTANAQVSLWLLSLGGNDGANEGEPLRGLEVAWDREAFEYLVSASWDAHGPLVSVQSRDQRTLRTLAVDPLTGASRTLHERTDPAWVEIVPGTPSRTASGALVLPHDADTTRHLTVGGAIVTPPGLQVRKVIDVTGERVLFTASADPTETHVWSYEPGGGTGESAGRTGGSGSSTGETGSGTGGGCTRLSDGPGLHTAVTGGGTTVLAGLTPDGHRVTVMRDGAPAGTIAALCEEPSVQPRPVHLTLGQRELRGALYLPSWYEPGARRLPVLLDPYAGPSVQLAIRARSWFACVSQWFAEQGFAVLVVDGRGTPGRGPRWEKEVHGDQLTPVLEDQVAALHAVAGRFPDLDLERVAIRGWSFGGFLAAAAVLHRPDVFHAAVAGAAPTDQRLYDTHWKERYLGHPEKCPENYARCSLAGHGHLLRRPLLLIHGLADDNVAPAHTLRFSAELLAAGKQHTVLPLPGASHAPADEAVNENLLRFQRDFLLGALEKRTADTGQPEG
ncbi:prolyl oligopeptidase family serine peptidase [Streptomyces sp. MST-110588]|uniref:S9 family peptidase n=1 Tax=Streptomyces sp. MST-110588 TaxID=2833628 RepID=UPI001F5D6D37|nr:prolyl oligopeptidase family serine peptidase [Streptomyces sp. MST-110588]UNO38728.1 prolyl oligopeptidase family serine peptidase [Streptomyces sp. MST-110588]